ncbi:MAG: hypothetical protein AB7U23_14545 [Dehalococcoidia bacterium]
MAEAIRSGGQAASDHLELCRLLDTLREAFVEDVAAAAAVQNVEHSPWGRPPDAVYCTNLEPGGRRTVVRYGDLKPLAQARRERARRELARAFDAVYEAAGEDMDPSLLDSLCERVREEAEASRSVGAMEDHAQEYACSVSNESYRRAQEDLDRAIRAREDAEHKILAHAEDHPRAAPRRPASRPRTSRPRAPRRSARSRPAPAVTTTTETAESGGDPPPSGDEPPLPLSAAAVLAVLRMADAATLGAIRDALGDVPRARFVPSASQRALWAYLLATPVARSLDLLALDLRRAKRTVLRDLRVLEARGIVHRVEGGGLLVAPLDGNQRGTKGELTGTPSSCSVVS